MPRPDPRGPRDPYGRADARLSEEIQFHIEQQTAELVRQGMTPAAARREALRRFGGVERAKDDARDERRFAWLHGTGRDFRYAARGLRRAPMFALVAITTLGLGIASSTAFFSVLQGVLLRELPYPRAERIVRLFQINTDGTPTGQPRRVGNASEPNVMDWRAGTRSFAAIAMMSSASGVPVSGGREPVIAGWAQVSKEFVDVMGVRPAIGRWFGPEEARVGGSPAAVVSASLRERLFGERLPPGAVLRIGPTSFAVIGEMPSAFRYPGTTDVWTPRELVAPSTARSAHNVQAIARLADGVTLDAAIADLSSVSRRLRAQHGDQTWMVDATAIGLLEQTTAGVQTALELLFGAACVLLVIACANVSNLLLAREATRRHMAALQLALGAGQWRIVRQRLAEIVMLCVAAALLGVVAAHAMIRGLLALDPGTIPRLREVQLDWASIAFAILVSAAAIMAVGFLTALRGRRRDLRPALDDMTRGASVGRGSERVREALVVAQVAMTVVLLTGTALLGRSFVEVLRVDPGYRTADLTVLDFVITRGADPDARQRQWQLQQEFMARVASLPGVSGVGLTSGLPAGGAAFYPNGRYLEMTRIDEFQSYEDIAALGHRVHERAGQAGFRVVGGEYFRVIGIPVLQGRAFDARDTADAPHVAVISRAMAESRWPDRDPIGRYVQFGNMDGDPRGFRVIGVVDDVRELTPEAPPGPLFYVEYRQRPGQGSRASLVVEGGTPDLGVLAQRALRELDPNVPLQVRRIEETFDAALRGRRFNLTLVAAFGLVALGLAAFGTYGLISFLVTQRRREIGIRLALGARSVKVVRLVVGRAARLAVLGAVVGLVATLWATTLIDGLLFSVSATDPITLAAAIGAACFAVVAASLIPAWRATAISPIETLRS
jgi:predicted permease